MAVLTLLSLLLYQTINGYYLSPNHLTWDQSVSYCQNYCGSNLSSIHNITQNNEMIVTIQSGHSLVDDHAAKDIFIGFSDGNDPRNFKWIDGTSFDFGAYPFSNPPWVQNQPDHQTGNSCGQIWVDSNYGWDDTSCTAERRALCNSCSGKLNKYIILKQAVTYPGAKYECQTQIGTTLASMHSQRDFKEMQSLCKLFDNDDCWIGLNDIGNEGTWEWEDGSTFDYGLPLGQYPWNAGRPDANSVNANAVELQRGSSYFLDDDSTGNGGYPICNMPSELCVNVTTFAVFAGNVTFSDCEAISMYKDRRNEAIISDKIYLNPNGIVLMDFLYRMDAVNNGRGGLILPITECTAYYIGILVNENQNKVFLQYIEYNGNNTDYDVTPLLQTDLSFSFNETVYYLLSVQMEPVSDRIKFTISVNNGNTLVHEHASTLDLYSMSVGIWSENTTIYGKSLYISGTPMNVNNIDIIPNIDNCKISNSTVNPTNNPSTSPSNKPTISPTYTPTYNPTHYGVFIKYGVIITVTFDYKFEKNDTDKIEEIIKDITNKLINNTIVQNCIESEDLNIHSVNKGDKTIVNATLFVCNQKAQNQLLTAFDQSNITAEIIVDIQKKIGLQIPVDSTTLDTDTIMIYRDTEDTVDSTTSTIQSIEKHDDDGNNDSNITVLIMVIFVVLLIFGSIYGVYTYHKQNKNTHEYGQTITELSKVPSVSKVKSVPMNTNDMNIEEQDDDNHEAGKQNKLNNDREHKETEEDLYGPGSNGTNNGYGNDNDNHTENGSSLPQFVSNDNDGTHSESELYEEAQVRTDDGGSIYGSASNVETGDVNTITNNGDDQNQDDQNQDDEKMYENYQNEETSQNPTPFTPKDNMILLNVDQGDIGNIGDV